MKTLTLDALIAELVVIRSRLAGTTPVVVMDDAGQVTEIAGAGASQFPGDAGPVDAVVIELR